MSQGKNEDKGLNSQLNDLRKLKWQNFVMLIISGTINAFAVNCFLAPVTLYDSGISGTSLLLAQLTLSISLWLLILNIPLFLYGFRKLGIVFTIYSIFAVCIYSLGSFIINDFIFPDMLEKGLSPITGGDLFLGAVFGGLLSGVGSGLTIRFGGSLDGIEVMAVAFSKKLGITVGTFVMIYNIILYVVAGIYNAINIGIEKAWTLPLYSIVAYFIGMKTIDFMVEGFDRSKSVMIITEKPDEVSSALMEAFGSGTTKISAKGGYSNADKTVIYFVVNRFQISRMKSIIVEIDKHAYVTVSDVADVFKGKN